MKLSEFDYNLPEELIAQEPSEPRDHSRLLVLDKKSGKIQHHTFYEVINYLDSGDILVVNNSKVFPARLYGHRKDTGGKVEILLNKNMTETPSVILGLDPRIQDSDSILDSLFHGNDKRTSTWEVMGKSLKTNTEIVFEKSNLKAFVSEKDEKIAKIEFNLSGEEFFSEIEKIGHTPLPPYIKKNDTKKDKVHYQTVYAEPIGSTAAPTAGLHFTKKLLKQIKDKGIDIVEVTLHVGLGTFAPIKTEQIEDHKIHSEYYSIIPSEIKKIVKAKKEGRRIIAVGTTSTRVLETIFTCRCHPKQSEGSKTINLSVDSRLRGNDRNKCGNDNKRIPTTDNLICGWTEIFIYPGYKFKCIDRLITNFHLPKSSLLMLVSAFAGKENIDRAYREAIKAKYRFFSYGDAMLII